MARPLLHLPHKLLPLIEATLLGRYQRFIAEARLQSGRVVLAHCVNPGQMEGLVSPGARIWLSKVPPSSPRKLRYTWELSEIEGERIGANTTMPNALAEALIAARLLHGFRGFDRLRREVPYGERSRVDLCLERGRQRHYVEVKNCHLIYPDGRGYFPDSLSVRASKHLRELQERVEAGERATVLFTAQRTEVECVRPSDVHDPNFARAARRARAAGVRFLAVQVRPTPESLIVEKLIPADLEFYDTAQMEHWMKANRELAPAWQVVKRAK